MNKEKLRIVSNKVVEFQKYIATKKEGYIPTPAESFMLTMLAKLSMRIDDLEHDMYSGVRMDQQQDLLGE